MALARTAITQGLAALAAQQNALALQWLERAHRLVPHDPNAALALATACLAAAPDRTAALLASVVKEYDVRQAWLVLAAARLRLHGPIAAAEPLAVVLARHAFSSDTATLAQQIGGATGWCGLRPDGKLEIHPSIPGRLEITLDGKPLSDRYLPSGWERRRLIQVRVNNTDLLGSPIRIDAIRRLDGCVEVCQDGLQGWAWHPGDWETAPVLTLIYAATGLRQTLIAIDETIIVPDIGPLARPRSFHLLRKDLLATAGPIHLCGPDGADLTGSPLNPFIDDAGYAAARGKRARTPSRTKPPSGQPAPTTIPQDWLGQRRPATVVIPVHDGGVIVLSCLASVLASVPKDTSVLVIDDGSSDPALTTALDTLTEQRKITLLRHERAMGFPASANTGIRSAVGHDVVLLNSDTLVPPRWLERLRDAAYAAADIGTVTPLSNEASILSYPGLAGTNPKPDQAATNRLDRLAYRANGRATTDIPVGVGFCLYLRRDCLTATGALRDELFAQGYGEENDLCLRAARLGWRNVAAIGLFVGHIGGTTFGASAKHLRQRNSRILERLHPGYDKLITAFIATDPLAEARRRIDRLVWKQRNRISRTAVILIAHNDGGGVEHQVGQAAKAHSKAGRRPIVLRPAEAAGNQPAIAVCDGLTSDFPNLIFVIPKELAALLRLLRTANAERVEVHHLVDYPPAIYDLIAQLGLPYHVHVHDYALLCPRVALVADQNQYCGEPDLASCEVCIRNNGHFLKEEITVATLRQRSATFLANAQQVIVPADDVRLRIQRYFPRLYPIVIPHEDDVAISLPRRSDVALSQVGHTRLIVCVVGAIGVHKGYEVLLACARDAVRRDLDLEFVVVGHTIDDARLMATGRVFVTGRFAPDEAVGLIIAQRARFGFVPSVCPETWCLGLGDLWRAGLPVAAFDIGAPAERIRHAGRGLILPLGLPVNALNDVLMTAIRTTPFDETLYPNRIV